MEFSKFQSAAAVIILVLLPLAAATKGDGFGYPNNPFFNSSNICEQVECGRGTCESSSNYSFNFRCDCEDGWRRTRLDDDDEDRLEYLPCIIPNCTLDYSCMPAAPPAPPPSRNMSTFDPCNWIYCGEGTCMRNSTYVHSHSCQCRPGYSNLLNITAFPCYNDCATDSESCQRLGVRQASSTTNPSISESNHGTPVSLVKFNWMAVLLLSTAIIFSSTY